MGSLNRALRAPLAGGAVAGLGAGREKKHGIFCLECFLALPDHVKFWARRGDERAMRWKVADMAALRRAGLRDQGRMAEADAVEVAYPQVERRR